MHKENMERVSRMVADEVQALKTQCDGERERAKVMKMEADRVNIKQKPPIFLTSTDEFLGKNNGLIIDSLNSRRCKKNVTSWRIRALC